MIFIILNLLTRSLVRPAGRLAEGEEKMEELLKLTGKAQDEGINKEGDQKHENEIEGKQKEGIPREDNQQEPIKENQEDQKVVQAGIPIC